MTRKPEVEATIAAMVSASSSAYRSANRQHVGADGQGGRRMTATTRADRRPKPQYATGKTRAAG